MCKQCIWIRMLFLSHIEHLRTLSVSLVHTLYEWHSSDVCWWCHRYLRLQCHCVDTNYHSICDVTDSLRLPLLELHSIRGFHFNFTLANVFPIRWQNSTTTFLEQRLNHYIWITNVLFQHYDNSHFMAKWNKSLGLPTQNTGCPQPYLFVVLVPAVFQQMAVNHE